MQGSTTWRVTMVGSKTSADESQKLQVPKSRHWDEPKTCPNFRNLVWLGSWVSQVMMTCYDPHPDVVSSACISSWFTTSAMTSTARKGDRLALSVLPGFINGVTQESIKIHPRSMGNQPNHHLWVIYWHLSYLIIDSDGPVTRDYLSLT